MSSNQSSEGDLERHQRGSLALDDADKDGFLHARTVLQLYS